MSAKRPPRRRRKRAGEWSRRYSAPTVKHTAMLAAMAAAEAPLEPTSWNAIERARIMHRPIRGIFIRRAHGEFVAVQFPQQNRASRGQFGHRSGIVGRAIVFQNFRSLAVAGAPCITSTSLMPMGMPASGKCFFIRQFATLWPSRQCDALALWRARGSATAMRESLILRRNGGVVRIGQRDCACFAADNCVTRGADGARRTREAAAGSGVQFCHSFSHENVSYSGLRMRSRVQLSPFNWPWGTSA